MKFVERFVIAGDNHGDKAHAPTVAAFFDFTKHFKPTIRIHAGDCFDLRCFRKGRTEQEGRDAIAADVDAGIDFIKRFKPQVFLRGNHDERLWDAAKGDDGKLADLAAYVALDITDALGTSCVMLPYDKRKGVWPLTKLWSVIHGYNSGMYAARHAAAAFGHVLMWHVHAHDIASVPRIDGAVGHTFGSLCDNGQDYNRAHLNTLRQSNGWCYGLKHPSGRCTIWHAEEIDGKWIMPSEFREVG